MSEKCFACVEPASERYTLILPDGTVLQEKIVCDRCISDFRETEWMDVIEEPVMMRGEQEGEGDN